MSTKSNKKENAAGHTPHKIMLISHSSELGGAELCFVETLKALSSTGKYELYSVFPERGSLNQLCIPYCKEIFIRYLPWWIDEGTKYPLRKKIERVTNIIASIKQAYKLLRAIRPDLIITNTSAIPEFAMATMFTKQKHCWFIHELVDKGLNCHLIYGNTLSKRIISMCSDMVFTNSNFINSHYARYVPKNRLRMLYQPVDIATLAVDKTKINESKMTLLIMGKVSAFKGQKDAVLACKELSRRGIDYQLLVVGAEPSSYLEEIVAIIDRNIQERVKLIPFTENPQSYYEQADIVLVCSQCEALGRVTIEAMKMGLPVVASNQGGNLELIQEGFNGYTYQLGNPTDLANKILQLENPIDRRKMGLNGKKWVLNHFNMDTFTKELDDTLKELLK
jgi:glycosyltransferase involved in cell wall biosynthesis